MIKQISLFFLICFVCFEANAQHYGLYNTRSLFDVFENPAVRSFKLDSSRKYAANFLIPNFSINAANKGSAQNLVRKAMTKHIFSADGLAIKDGIPNTVFENSNIYLLTFRIFSRYKNNQEIGFAWQVRSDAVLEYTNESLAILDNYEHFSQIPYVDIFKTKGYQQAYHQFSISIRENWNKKLAFGVKLSLLSGIAYNELRIKNSYIYADVQNDRLDVGVAGSYKGSFIEYDELNHKTFFPTFKNHGASISLGTTYQAGSGYFIMANVKDLGFIKWNKQSYAANFGTIKSLYGISTYSTADINEEITSIVDDAQKQTGFYKPTNAKADFLISRTFHTYKPSLIVSKNIFHSGGDIAFVNTFLFNKFSASLIPTYNLNDFMMLGAQGMYQTPNFEIFLGTDNLGKTLSTARGLQKSDASIGKGYLGASVYFGFGIKFGQIVKDLPRVF